MTTQTDGENSLRTTIVCLLCCLFACAAAFFGLFLMMSRGTAELTPIGDVAGALSVAPDAAKTQRLMPGYTRLLNGERDASRAVFGIYSGRIRVAVVRSEADGQWVLDSLLAQQAMAGATASFVEDVRVEPCVGSPLGREEALMVACDAEISPLYYAASAGDSVDAVCAAFSMTTQEFAALNEDQADAALVAGQLVSVKAGGAPLFTVQNVVVSTEEKTVPHTTKTVSDNTILKGQSVVKKAGVNGLMRRTITVTHIAGKEVSRETTDFVTVREPVEKVVHQGTKPPSDAASAPNFRWPLTGRFSSPFGPRWGRMHEGIDIAVSTGTTVRASAGGTVLRAFNNGGYGLFVEIDHGNGWITRYAHNSKLLVKAGEKVVRGQEIALSGNTGSSTGPHLHFEIRRRGTAVDPMLYLP